MDSDDYWIDDDALRKFEIKIKEEKPDVAVFKNCIYDELTGTFKEPKKDRESEIALEDAIKLEYFDFSAWNKAVKRSLLVDNNIALKKEYLRICFGVIRSFCTLRKFLSA